MAARFPVQRIIEDQIFVFLMFPEFMRKSTDIAADLLCFAFEDVTDVVLDLFEIFHQMFVLGEKSLDMGDVSRCQLGHQVMQTLVTFFRLEMLFEERLQEGQLVRDIGQFGGCFQLAE